MPPEKHSVFLSYLQQIPYAGEQGICVADQAMFKGMAGKVMIAFAR